MKQVCNGGTGVSSAEHEVCCRGYEIIAATLCGGDSLSNSGENKRFCYFIPGSKLRVEHIATQSLMI